LSAYVVLDSMPDQRYHGVITKVAPLPDSQSRWGNPNLKVYATEIRIADHLPDVKPGVSARAEIIVTNLADVSDRAHPGRDNAPWPTDGLRRRRSSPAGPGWRGHV
jgi:hypothetical protein